MHNRYEDVAICAFDGWSGDILAGAAFKAQPLPPFVTDQPFSLFIVAVKYGLIIRFLPYTISVAKGSIFGNLLVNTKINITVDAIINIVIPIVRYICL